MKQLTGLDASFLNIETPTTYGHVSSLVILDPSTGSGDVYGDLKRTVSERLHLVEIYRRRLAEVPFGIDHPYWVDDADFDLEFHLREIAIPAPGDDRQLGEQIARIVARPLDRARPLWEFYVLTGLAGGRVGVLTKIHHSTIDGVSGVAFLHALLDTEPDGSPVEPPVGPWEPERTPSSLELLGRSVLGYWTRPKKAIQLSLRSTRMVARLTGNEPLRSMALGAVPGLSRLGLVNRDRSLIEPTLPNRPAPATRFNRSVTPHRRFAFATLSLTDAQRVKRAFGVTVNDVVMALCAGALRRYLLSHDELPHDPLLAMVPVSVRTGSSTSFDTQVTGMLAPLHTSIADPALRLLAIHESMVAAKEMQDAIPADLLADITEFAPPSLVNQAARLASRTKIADRVNPPMNLILSNVPGPRQPLYLGGATMEHFYPVSAVAETQGLNMTVQSYLDNLDFGLISCRELVPDLWDLCGYLADEMTELLAAVDRLEAGAASA